MPADVQLTEQYTSSAPAQAVFLSEQYAQVYTLPEVQITEQYALAAGGSVATVSVVEQYALFGQPADVIMPGGAKASGSGSWTPYYMHDSDGSGVWL